ncbi:hypothetical protein K458DRAFT_420920 [Lentithecium fluviatile CBS 122367]|uniref:Uncharacterized protein n=1 Tax=Lentithecium fluviatile CBS 122367 TaxID=1168545 RepID=A0A6G1IRZ5_9PLEO|nr:hypothetical protein K458DRAFT_420920 [Lentithecium fluviatile CBS 122367]
MVSFKSVAAVLAFNVLSATAAPASSPVEMRGEVNVLAQASIYMCKDIRWNGDCRNVLVNLDTCTNVPSGWNDVISSIRNDSRSNYKCTWYLNANCGGSSYDNQDDANLADGNGKFNDSISSYSCKNK